MGREATKAAGNPWYEARIKAAQYDDRLSFVENTHTYLLDGVAIPSVSKIMEPLRVAQYAGVNEQTLNRAADKGTAVHKLE